MNIEFHYYLTKYLALEAGFDSNEAEIIAYSSQYIDDNSIQYKIKLPDGSEYKNYITQTQDITKPEKKLMRIYFLFHFMPGNPTSPKTRRKDGKMHLLNTTSSSTHAQEIFYDATKSENLYSLGIASHMLADTISHQNFIGNFDEMNAMKGVWESLVPNIGHADAGNKPDIPNLIWHDPRLIEENANIDNTERVLLAANKLYKNFLMFTASPTNWTQVKSNINRVLQDKIDERHISSYKRQMEERIMIYKELIAEHDTDADYNPYKWFSNAIVEEIKFLDDKKFKFDPIKDKLSFDDNYKKTNWYRFQEAAKNYQKRAADKMYPIFSQIELKEW
ncbi:MAG: hypothetical protein K9N07_04480 [Candidatus Cloacimonetes bacterium]|nr:hypothetical protein [Candidatus Cloacimonadota bacterium]